MGHIFFIIGLFVLVIEIVNLIIVFAFSSYKIPQIFRNLHHNYGLSTVVIIFFVLLFSANLFRLSKFNYWKLGINFLFSFLWCSAFCGFCSALFFPDIKSKIGFCLGGTFGNSLQDFISTYIGVYSGFIFLCIIIIPYLKYISKVTTQYFEVNEHGEIIGTKKKELELEDSVLLKDESISHQESGSLNLVYNQDNEKNNNCSCESTNTSRVLREDNAKETDGNTIGDGAYEKLPPYDPRKDLEYYKFPTIDLLNKYDTGDQQIDVEEQNVNKDRIVKILDDYGAKISAIRATVGPTITLYEVTPAPGVRVSKIKSLSDEIALALMVANVRIVGPIPGKGTIGIEVPNSKPRIVSMESLLNSKCFQETEYELPIAVGKTMTDEVFMVDLAKLPHLLVAGATGQGKSVGLNAIITSLLYKKHPAELKIVMIDSTKVELSLYSPIENFFLTTVEDTQEPIITNASKAVDTLQSLVQMMEYRYDLLKAAYAKNIKEYNEKFCARKLNPAKGYKYMPYIVVIIDEYGDLIESKGLEIEKPLTKLAQKARPIGIHLVISTKRPTVDVVTGTIKANFPARMAFKVSSMTDSRTILDCSGANHLSGSGDMLFMAGMESVRVQCAFVDTSEVERIVKFIASQQRYFPYYLHIDTADLDDGCMGSRDAGPLDSMFEEAARLIVIHQQGSTSLIQRKMGLGYNRAGRIMDQLEAMGIVGPSRGAMPREVLVPDEVALNAILKKIDFS